MVRCRDAGAFSQSQCGFLPSLHAVGVGFLGKLRDGEMSVLVDDGPLDAGEEKLGVWGCVEIAIEATGIVRGFGYGLETAIPATLSRSASGTPSSFRTSGASSFRAEARRRAASDSNGSVTPRGSDCRHRPIGDGDRRVEGSIGEMHAGRRFYNAVELRHVVARNNHRALHTEPPGLIGNTGEARLR